MARTITCLHAMERHGVTKDQAQVPAKRAGGWQATWRERVTDPMYRGLKAIVGCIVGRDSADGCTWPQRDVRKSRPTTI
jgi:hypothetical protein